MRLGQHLGHRPLQKVAKEGVVAWWRRKQTPPAGSAGGAGLAATAGTGFQKRSAAERRPRRGPGVGERLPPLARKGNIMMKTAHVCGSAGPTRGRRPGAEPCSVELCPARLRSLDLALQPQTTSALSPNRGQGWGTHTTSGWGAGKGACVRPPPECPHLVPRARVFA